MIETMELISYYLLHSFHVLYRCTLNDFIIPLGMPSELLSNVVKFWEFVLYGIRNSRLTEQNCGIKMGGPIGGGGY